MKKLIIFAIIGWMSVMACSAQSKIGIGLQVYPETSTPQIKVIGTYNEMPGFVGGEVVFSQDSFIPTCLIGWEREGSFLNIGVPIRLSLYDKKNPALGLGVILSCRVLEQIGISAIGNFDYEINRQLTTADKLPNKRHYSLGILVYYSFD